MPKLLVLETPPTLPPDSMDAGTTAVIATRGGVVLRIALVSTSVAPVAVRPWIYLGGAWEPCRADGAGAGPAPVTADHTVNGGQANGVFMTGPTAASFCLFAESGDPDDVASASLDEYFLRS